MAYKDEYEVARLYTDGRFLDALNRKFEGDYTLEFHLAPPLLANRDHVGHLVKKGYGAWMMAAFRLLAHLKGLRGTAFDPFGRTAERRTERQLIEDYFVRIDALLAGLTHDNHALAVEIASLPEHIRGYGHVKERHLAEVKEREAALVARFRNPGKALSAAE
jgi:indolepyruvate ferredoxin oxidoreductase